MLCMLEISQTTFTFDTAYFFYPPLPRAGINPNCWYVRGTWNTKYGIKIGQNTKGRAGCNPFKSSESGELNAIRTQFGALGGFLFSFIFVSVTHLLYIHRYMYFLSALICLSVWIEHFQLQSRSPLENNCFDCAKREFR